MAGGKAMKQTMAWAMLAIWGMALPAAAKSYEAIPGESKLTYYLRHPLHMVEGVSKDFSCTVDLPEDTLQAKIRVKAPIIAFNSGNSNRDAHALEILDAFKHPFVEFASDSLRRDSDGYKVFGQLTFHGIRRPVNFRVTPKYADGKVRIHGKFAVKLSDFKVERPSLLLVRTDDELRIEIDVWARYP
jgi:polyisoprenoid-binding protein YceI